MEHYPLGREPAPLSGQRPRLAMLDDEGDFCDLVEKIATSSGYEVFTTTRARLFLDHLDGNAADVIVLDLHMPDSDGIEVLRLLAGLGVVANILIASGADGRVMETALELGRERGLRMAGVIHKPISVAALRELLQSQIGADDPLSPGRLSEGIRNGELRLHYQPVFDLRAERVVGVEALARWEHPELGLLPPNKFIPMAERFGLIGALTDWVLAEAVRQAGLWYAGGLPLNIAANISIASLPDYGLPDRLEAMCRNVGIPNAQVSLELTETAAMRSPARLMEVFTRFRLKGFDLSLDDFGTGYSSLVQLQRLPFSALKIDRSFVGSMIERTSGAAIVTALIGLAAALELRCIAEGVETEEMLQFLRERGCDHAQGYYIARPMEAAAVAEFVSH
ncbi:MAG: EAL domain-containing protein [Alphaproteobacteria bacterium]